ncbi:FAD-dependent oxidoreductase [Actinospica durhamensis]|uniref:FAD-dependent oxidoreductase n=1 Tax=Actinospica durhamensis TaxID=1508375 RepID=A0A941EVF2_9ACTN|nr:FAD-dependent oxidoreductase [Actinospica durhamensis]
MARLEERGGAIRVVLAEGAVLEAELVVTAVGDVPNTRWLADTGLTRDGVLEVDARGRVREDIAAAGDLLPVEGPPEYVDGAPGAPSLLRWTRTDGSAAAAALNYRIPVPRLRRLCRPGA